MMRVTVFGTAAILLALVSAACSRSPRVTFYTLAPEAKVEAPLPDHMVPAIAVGPVTLPELVDRPQLVVRVAANRVDILETHRWAEPLKSEIPRLIAENLGRLLGSNRVSSHQHYSGSDAHYRVLLDILRFESAPGESVIVETAWTLRRSAGGAPKKGRTLVREKTTGAGYDALAAAYSRALACVSEDLARAVRAEDAAGR